MCAHVQNQRIARASERASGESVGFNLLDCRHGEGGKNPRNGESRMQINAALVYLVRTCNKIEYRQYSNLTRLDREIIDV